MESYFLPGLTATYGLMRNIGKKYRRQFLNAFLRLLPMGAKMLLTLYMGRFFKLEDIGAYGLVMGSVTILGIILGQNFVYVVNRDIAGTPPASALYRVRDQLLLYAFNYIALAIGIGILIQFRLTDIAPGILVYTLVLSVLESVGTVTYYNMESLNQQILANLMFCIRAGLWVVPVIILCALNPACRNAETVLGAWTIGVIASLAATLWSWRDLPWLATMRKPVDWAWLRTGLKKVSLIWIGMIGVVGGTWLDRFVVDHFLTISDVGVLTFYFSFTNSMLTLMQSGVMAFAIPRLIQHFREGKHAAFHREAHRTKIQIALGAAGVAVTLGIVVPLFAYLSGRDAIVAGLGTFWLMLLATWVRSSAETYYNILYALHQDTPVWLGNLIFLGLSFGCNVLFVSQLGFMGIGISSTVAASTLLLWRWWFVRRYMKNHNAAQLEARS